MVWIIVQRGSGEYRGSPVQDELLTTSYAALERGRTEIEKAEYGIMPVDISIKQTPGIRLGDIAKVIDILRGVTWFGKITGISHTSDGPVGYLTNLTVERGRYS